MIDVSEFESVTRAISNVYDVFADIPRPSQLNTCPCCVDNATRDRLLVTPLWEIPTDDLSGYARAVSFTMGTPEELQFFLPRILEHMISDAGWITGPVEMTERILWAGFDNWPGGRREVIRLLYEAMFDAALCSYAPSELAEYLRALANLRVPVRDSLEKLEQRPGQVRNYYDVEGQDLVEGQMGRWPRNKLH